MTETVKILSDLLPLSEFYSGDFPLHVEWIEGEEMPEPYKSLLVHDSDMTPTLEAFHGREIHLNVLDLRFEDGILSREVVLQLNDSDRPVEFGAIHIHLETFEHEPKQVILQGYRPLGSILHDFEIPHESHPSGFFSVEPDDLIKKYLGFKDDQLLYGRCNRLIHQSGAPLADVVEILPPSEGTGESE